MRRVKPVSVSYPKGYFTELIFKHNFPPNWQPQPLDRSTAINAKTATANRERAAGEGIGWADGTTPMPGTPKYLKPAWMVMN